MDVIAHKSMNYKFNMTHHRERFSGGTVGDGGETRGVGCVLGV